ncbi:hypothetical protein KCU73_g311, partial [Aureobasidium melanogenum]
MSVSDSNSLPPGSDASTRSGRENGRKRARNSTGTGTRVAKQARAVHHFSTPGPPVRGSISDVINNSNVSPNPGVWEAVNKQNATPVASPSLTKSEETFAQLAKNVLLEHPEGRTSEQISIAVHETGIKGKDLSVIKPNVSAALSSHSRGDKAIFKKGPQTEKKQIWLLKNPDSSPLMRDETLERIFASGGTDTTVGAGTPRARGPGEQHSTTSDHVSVHGEQSAEEHSETDKGDAATLADADSVEVAQMINNVIASADQTPPPGAPDGPAAALAVEPSQHSHLHELQQDGLPPVDRLEELSAPDPKPSVLESVQAAGTPFSSPAFTTEEGTVLAPQRVAVETESTQPAPMEAQTGAVARDVSPERALPLHLAAMIGMHVKTFIDCHQPQPLVFQKYLSSCDRSDGDAQAAFKDIVRPLGANTTLESTSSQPVSTFQDAQQALEDVRRAKAVERPIDVAIVDCNMVQAAMNAEIARLRHVVSDLDSLRETLQETKGQAAAIRDSSGRRIKAFIGGQDNDGQNID